MNRLLIILTLLSLVAENLATRVPSRRYLKKCKDGEQKKGNKCEDCPQGFFQPDDHHELSACKSCPTGRYGNQEKQVELESCKVCVAGQYNDILAATSCKECVAGRYQLLEADPGREGECVQCPKGKYNSKEGMVSWESCELCAVDFFQNQAGQAICKSCLEGYSHLSDPSYNKWYTQGITGRSNCQRSCNPGYYKSVGNNLCQSCPRGYVNNIEQSVACDRCDAGTYSSQEGSTICKDCPKGYFLFENAVNIGITSCIKCAFGKYMNEIGSIATSCKSCPSGRYLESEINVDQTSISDCKLCQIGRYNPSNTSALSICFECLSQTEIGSTTCKDCGIGKKVGVASCEDCPKGYYNIQTKQTECTLCPVGFYNSYEAQYVCEACGIGKYMTRSWVEVISIAHTSCLDCITGKYQPLLGQVASSSCLDCSAGQWSSTVAAGPVSECTSCDAGFYSATVGATNVDVCQKCGLGRFSVTIGAVKEDFCEACPSGFYGNQKGVVYCMPCPLGQHNPEIGLDSCIQCSTGRYSNFFPNNKTSCVGCPTGFHAPSLGSVFCVLCAGGKYNSNTGQEECTPCQAGMYRGDVHDSTKCLHCPMGFAISSEGGRRCQICQGGRYSAISSNNLFISCNECPAGYVSHEKNTTECYACGLGKYSTSASKSCSSCKQGEYADSIGTPKSCKQCLKLGEIYYSNIQGAHTCQTCDGNTPKSNGITCDSLPLKSEDISAPISIQVQVDQTGLELNISWDCNDDHAVENKAKYYLEYVMEDGVCNLTETSSPIQHQCCDARDWVPTTPDVIQSQIFEVLTKDVYTYQKHNDPTEKKEIIQCQQTTDVNLKSIKKINFPITLPNPAWCTKIKQLRIRRELHGGSVVGVSDYTMLPLLWTSARDCDFARYLDIKATTSITENKIKKFRKTINQYGIIQQTLLATSKTVALIAATPTNPSEYSCTFCDPGSSCTGALLQEEVRPLFGWYKLHTGNKVVSYGNDTAKASIFLPCRHKAACLGAANNDINYIGKYFDPYRNDTDPATLELPGGCNEAAGYQNYCSIDGDTTVGHTKYPDSCRLCARCLPNYRRTNGGYGYECQKCPEHSQNIVFLVMGVCIATFMVFVLLSIGMDDVLDGNASDALTRVLVNFLQVIAIFATFPLEWPETIQSIFFMSGVASTIGSFLLNPECELKLNVLEIYYSKMVVWSTVPICVVLLCYIGWKLNACITGKHWTKEEQQRIEQIPIGKIPKRGTVLLNPNNTTNLNSRWKKHTTADGNIYYEDTLDPDKKTTWTNHEFENNSTIQELRNVDQEKNKKEKDMTEKDIEDQSQLITTSSTSSMKIPTMTLSSQKTMASTKDGGSRKFNLALASRKPTPKDNFVVCAVILLHLLYPTACQNAFRVLSCTEVNHVWYLQADLETRCWQGSHLIMILTVCLPQVLLYVVGFPLASLLMLFKNRHRLNHARTKYRYGMLYVGLKKNRYYWEVVICARKAGLFSLSVIGSANAGLAVQTHLAMLVLMAALVTHLIGRPYMKGWELLDGFETSGLVVCFCMMWAGIVFYNEAALEIKHFVTVILATINFSYTIFTIVVLMRQKAAEESPIAGHLRRNFCCCCSDIRLKKIGDLIPAIHDGGQNWMTTTPGDTEGTSTNQKTTSMLNYDNLNPSFNNKERKGTIKKEKVVVNVETENGTSSSSTRSKEIELVETLPKGWQLVPGKNAGGTGAVETYYYNTESGETQWNRPI